MKYSQAALGRVFIIRLEHGDILHEKIEELAREMGVRAASILLVGGVDKGSRLVVGPKTGDALPAVPLVHKLEEPHEVCGTGTLFPDETGSPVLHLHVSCGRKNKAVTGCVRQGVRTWHVLEVVLQELTNSSAVRRQDPATGFTLMQPQ